MKEFSLILLILIAFISVSVFVYAKSFRDVESFISQLVEKQKYPLHKDITATVFWVGEGESSENDYISNDQSAWNRNWLKDFGGVDSPSSRNGYYPQGFIPKENSFYIALPYYDFAGRRHKENIKLIPWYQESIQSGVSLVKNRWLKIISGEKVCYAQWEDVGPTETDDVEYVFGTSRPKNKFGVGAGIDISPAVRDCLGVGDVSYIDWQFVDEKNVPDGPWMEIITRSGPSWANSSQ